MGLVPVNSIGLVGVRIEEGRARLRIHLVDAPGTMVDVVTAGDH